MPHERRHLCHLGIEGEAFGGELDKLQADLASLDAVLRMYDVEPSEIPTKGRMPVRSAYFGRNEITRRCRDMLRERGTIKADDVSAQAMRDEGLDPENRKLRRDCF